MFDVLPSMLLEIKYNYFIYGIPLKFLKSAIQNLALAKLSDIIQKTVPTIPNENLKLFVMRIKGKR